MSTQSRPTQLKRLPPIKKLSKFMPTPHSAAGSQRKQRPINRAVAVNQKIMAVNQRIFQRQRRQALQNERVSPTGNINQRIFQRQRLQALQNERFSPNGNTNQRNQFAVRQRQFVLRQNQIVRRQQYNQQRIINSNTSKFCFLGLCRVYVDFWLIGFGSFLKGVLPRRQVNLAPGNNVRRQLTGRTPNRNRSAAQPYQQYIQQARALIRAQNEGRGGNFYVDSPVGGPLVTRRGGRGRFRG